LDKLADALEGLPKQKLHCSNLGADALHMAIKDYEEKTTRKHRLKVPVKIEHKKGSHREKFFCPYCDIEMDASVKFCEACQSNLEEEH